VYLTPPPLKEFPLEMGIGAWVKKTSDGATGPRRTFDDILSRLDTIHERDRQTEEQTLADSKDSAYT